MEALLTISYKTLWNLSVHKELMKKDLAEMANISPASIAKLGRNENVNTDILLRICSALECDISDIMEVTEDS